MKFARTLAAGILASTVTLSLAVLPSYATTKLDSRGAGAKTLAASRADAGTSGLSMHPADAQWINWGSYVTRAMAVEGIALCKEWIIRNNFLLADYEFKIEWSAFRASYVASYRYLS